MNDSTQTLTVELPRAVRRTCPKCKYVRDTSEVVCPACGESLQSVNRIRVTGGFLVVMGTMLTAFVGWLAVWMLNAAGPGGKSAYHGSPSQTAYIIFVGVLLILISLNAAAAGIWQVVFARRSKPLMITMGILGFGFIVAGFVAFLSK